MTVARCTKLLGVPYFWHKVSANETGFFAGWAVVQPLAHSRMLVGQ